ncbi:hypothetical protein Tco_0546651 [Tanacetum coccineum]
MPVVCHRFTDTLKRFRTYGGISNNRPLWRDNIKQRKDESTQRPLVPESTDDTLQVLGLHEEQRISGFIHVLRTRSLVEHLSIDLPSTYKGLMENPTPGSKQEKWQLMELLMIKGKTLKGRRDPLETITEDKKAGLGSPHTEDQTMDCSLTCPKAQERSSPQKRQLRVSNSLLVCLEARRSRDMSKYCHFHEDHGHDTNNCRQLRN